MPALGCAQPRSVTFTSAGARRRTATLPRHVPPHRRLAPARLEAEACKIVSGALAHAEKMAAWQEEKARRKAVREEAAS